MPHDCFLSYSSADFLISQRIYDRLVAEGLDVWFDKRRLDPGLEWHREIEAACESSRVLLPILTPNWKTSVWTRYETYGGENIIPLLVSGAWHEVSTPPLSRYQKHEIRLDPDHLNGDDWHRLIAAIGVACSRPVLERAERIKLLKHSSAPIFVGRDSSLAELHERLFTNPTADLTQGRMVAITATGGMGKSTFARHYAEKFWRPYRLIFWIDCGASPMTGFAQIHDILRPDRIFSDLSDEDKARWALATLKDTHGDPFLLILDDAENQDSVDPWLPHGSNCHVLMTSRYTAWTGAIGVFEIGAVDKRSARDLLLKSSGINESDNDFKIERDCADAVAIKVECLPLALEQAAAYVRHQPPGFGFTGYLRIYEENERDLLNAATRGATAYPHSVFLTWRATIDKLPKEARRILRLHSWFAPKYLPIDVYIKGAKLVHPGATEHEIRTWIGHLIDYSLMSKWPGDMVAVHPLVQAVERLSKLPRDSSYVLACELFGVAAEKPTWELSSRQLWNVLLPHAEALRKHGGGTSTFCSLGLLAKMGSVHLFRGDYKAAIPLLRECLAQYEILRGTEHTDTLTMTENLAVAIGHEGGFVEAEELHKRTLEVRQRLLGEKHLDSLSSVHNLGSFLASQGKYADAQLLLSRALNGRQRVLGRKHPSVAGSAMELAHALDMQGKHSEAERLLSESLSVLEESLGRDHPYTLRALNNLAIVSMKLGRAAEAEVLIDRAVKGSDGLLGSHHPDTLMRMMNSIMLLEREGKYADAEGSLRSVLAMQEAAIGPEHPDTLQTVKNLAAILCRQGKYSEAVPFLLRARDGMITVLGKDHPLTREVSKGLDECRFVASPNSLAGLARFILSKATKH